ncbi:MAG TPA: ATP-binding protein [Terriglobia bacterium]|nr:ATP-binding protein [Terriglobia bacterium]
MPKILLVDESASDRRHTADLLQRNGNAEVIYSGSGNEALSAIERLSPDVVLAALPAQGTDFLRVLQDIHFRYPSLPIILMTAEAVTPVLLKALHQGAVSFVPKTNLGHYLARTLDHVLKLSRTGRRQRLVGYLCQSESSFSLENDPELIAPMVAHLQEGAARLKGMDETMRMQLCVALHEGLLNAMYHGNLEVSSELREAGEAAFIAAAEQRRRSWPHRDRRVHVKATLTPSEAVFVIRDEGPGFNPEAIPDPTAPDNLSKASGRGILLMRTFVDDLHYSATGNELTLVKRLPANGDRS